MWMLTDSMARLRAHIDAAHNARETLMMDLKHNVEDLKHGAAAMRSNFRNNHIAMSRKMRADQSAFMSKLKSGVSGMLADFHNERTEMRRMAQKNMSNFLSKLRSAVSNIKQTTTSTMARLHKANEEMFKDARLDRFAFVSDIKRRVAGMRLGLASDLAGARQTWLGMRPAMHRAKEGAKQAKEDTERPTNVVAEKHRSGLKTRAAGRTSAKGKKKQ